MKPIKLQGQKLLYRQIAEHILLDIKSGRLRPGDRLPTERELAEQLRVARGTVKKAYKELADSNVIQIKQGSGSYVLGDRDATGAELRQYAAQLIDRLLNKLVAWDLSPRDIEVLLNMGLARLRPSRRSVRAVVIDCCVESLALYRRQLAYIPNLELDILLLDRVVVDPDPHALLASYDLVLTTATHIAQVEDCLNAVDIKVIPAELSLSRHTIVSISALSPASRVGVVCSSNRFANVISEHLGMLAPAHKDVPVSFQTELANVSRFIRQFDAILIAPDSTLLDPGAGSDILSRFTKTGGQIIPFEYLVTRTSLLQIEEQVYAALHQRIGREPAPV